MYSCTKILLRWVWLNWLECQVVTLKVGGSNPSIHPIAKEQKSHQFWQVLPAGFKPERELRIQKHIVSRFHLIKLILISQNQSSWGVGAKMRLWSLTYTNLTQAASPDLLKVNFLNRDFKLMGSQSLIDKAHYKIMPTSVKTMNAVHFDKRLLKTFKTFTLSQMSSAHTLTKPHASFSSFYVAQAHGGSILLNVGKFFQKWKLAYFLLFNLFYYRIKTLTFAQSFFKSEVLSINWSDMNHLGFMWRYIRPFLVYKPIKIHDSLSFILRKLRLMNISTALVVNLLYHKNTMYYLRRSTFFTIALVPSTYAINSADFAVPTLTMSQVTDAYFISYLLVIKRQSLQKTYLADYKHIT